MRDHLWKHELSYTNCTRKPEFTKLGSIVEKDRAYLQCHEEYMDKMNNKLEVELTERAKNLFG